MSATTLDKDLAHLESKISENPGLKYSEASEELRVTLKDLNTAVNEPTIALDHPSRKSVDCFSQCSLELYSAERAPEFSSNSIASTSGGSTFTQVKLPKISLSTFHGDPLKWGAFWQS